MATHEPASAELREVLHRLDTLERRDRRWKLATVALVTIVAGIAAGPVPSERAVSARPPDPPGKTPVAQSVTASSFVLLDAKGRRRAVLTEESLAFYADDDTKRLELGTARGSCPSDPGKESTGAFLNFFDLKGKLRLGLTSSQNGWSTLSFHGQDGTGCARINVSDECRSELVLGTLERGTGRLWNDEGGQANIDLLDGEKIRWTTRAATQTPTPR